jgi:chromosome segregation ATPase
MAAKNVDINIRTKADVAGAKQTETAMKSLDTATQKVNTTTNTTTASTSKLGQVAGNAGYQIQDFAVQVGGGTNALVAFSQQAPQFLGSFGPQGAVAGALVAIGAIAAKVFFDMAENAAMTGEAMEDMSDKLKEAFSASAAKAIDDFNVRIRQSTEFAQTLRDAELQLKEARDQRAASDARLIDAQLKLDEAAISYLASTGQIINAEESLLAVRQQAAEATKNAQIAEANSEVERQRDLYANILKQRKDVDSEVQDAKKKLAQLEEQQARAASNRAFYTKQDKDLIKAGVFDEGYQSARTVEATGQFDSIQKQIENLYKIIEDKPQRMQEIANEAYAQAANVDAAIIEAEIKISEINTKFNLTQQAQNLTSATDQIKTGADEIVKGVSQIEAITPIQQQAKDQIIQAASDGVITAQESLAISSNLRTLMGSLKAGQESNLGTLRELLSVNDAVRIKMQSMANEIKGLKDKINNITVR